MIQKLFRRVIATGMIGAMVLIASTSAFAASDIGIIMDGKPLSTSTAPTIINGSTLVPMRGIFEALGANVSWDQATQTVSGTKGNTKIVLQIGSNDGTVNGAQVPLSIPAQVINGSTMVPLRFVGEALGTTVQWDSVNRNVVILSSQSQSSSQTSMTTNNGTTIANYDSYVGTWKEMNPGQNGSLQLVVSHKDGNTYTFSSYDIQPDGSRIPLDDTQDLTVNSDGDTPIYYENDRHATPTRYHLQDGKIVIEFGGYFGPDSITYIKSE